jgi:hypothetical protein
MDSLLGPIYEKVKQYLSEFIKHVEDKTDTIDKLISISSLNRFLENFNSDNSESAILEKLPLFLDYIHT